MQDSLVAVWGLGRFGGGRAAARFCARRGASLRIIDQRPVEELRKAIAEDPELTGAVIDFAPESHKALEGIELLVVNPAIKPTHPLLQRASARGIPQSQEIDLFLGAFDGRVCAITGSNGKSSTTAMLGHTLGELLGHQRVLIGGNLGNSLLDDEERWNDASWAVLEISSFQAERLATRNCLDALLLTPITSDHLDWHGQIEKYQAAKMRLLDALVPSGTCIAHNKCGVARAAARRDPRVELLASDARPAPGALPIAGAFQLDNAALVAAFVRGVLGIREREILDALASFDGLPHRLRRVGCAHGVTFWDNGISTSAESTLSAIEALRERGPVRWIAGGRAKSPELDAHLACARLVASSHFFGEVGPRLHARLVDSDDPERVTLHKRQVEALDVAWRACREGDQLLVSPAFASFDQYPNFAARAREAVDWWSRGPAESAQGAGR